MSESSPEEYVPLVPPVESIEPIVSTDVEVNDIQPILRPSIQSQVVKIPIQPVPDVPKVVGSFSVNVTDLVLFKSVSVVASVYYTTGELAFVKTFTMDGDDYTNWMNDDQYVINWVAAKLGFTVA